MSVAGEPKYLMQIPLNVPTILTLGLIKMITQNTLREEFSYNASTGLFHVLKHNQNSSRKIGDVVGSLKQNGYLNIYLNKKIYLAHRLAWLYVYGQLPKLQIDHINGIKTDNRISNLRLSTASQNAQNQTKAKATNKTNLLGVRKKPNKNVFEASIKVNGKNVYIGCFKTAQLAHEAYINRKRELHEFNTL